MNNFSIRTSISLCATLAVLGFTADLNAQATRTWVSGVGDDVNPCSRTAPCKTFAGAISKTAAGGEINVLDPGGFGAVTITKSITIDGGNGPHASVLSGATNGIIVNCTSGTGPNDIVILRNLSINGAGINTQNGVGINGIRFLAGNTVHVENCTIQRFTQNGIFVDRAAANGSLTVKNCQIRQCTQAGIRTQTTVGTVNTVIEDTDIRNCADGILAGNGTRLTVRGSALNANSRCIKLTGAVGLSTKAVIEDCLMANSITGLQVETANSTARILGCELVQNTDSMLLIGGGIIQSDGTNVQVGNTNPTPAVAPLTAPGASTF